LFANFVLYVVLLSFVFLLLRRPLISTLFPYTTLFRSIEPPTVLGRDVGRDIVQVGQIVEVEVGVTEAGTQRGEVVTRPLLRLSGDRKSTRLNSSHVANSYAVFCLKKKKNKHNQLTRLF